MSESMTDGKAATRQANRHHRLVDAVMAAGSMSIEDLAAYLNVSVMTVHRDLVELESQNVLRKTRGYATALPSSTVESNDAYRRTQQRAEKAELSAAALKFIQQGQSIMLDNSTTILPLLPQLESKAPLKVVSNSLSVINALTSAQHIEVVAAGGDYQAWCDGFVGGLTVDFFASVQVDILIASASAVVNGACYHQQENLVSIKRAMMKSAATKVLVLDHTKFERRAMYRVCDVSEFDHIIVDSRTPKPIVEALISDGLDVTVAPRIKQSGPA